jgi:hypothetical protein
MGKGKSLPAKGGEVEVVDKEHHVQDSRECECLRKKKMFWANDSAAG